MNKLNGLVVVAGLVASSIGLAQLHPFGNPQNMPSQPRGSLLSSSNMPLNTRNVLIAKCANCHSDATSWPVYSRAAPFSWLVEHDVIEGRAHLNLSNWQALSEDRWQILAQEIVSQARRGTMPPLPYRLVHWSARLSASDVAALTALAPEAFETAQAIPGDATRGKSVFERRCTGCHALDENREGPHLRGVYSRNAGSAPNFKYSAALKNSKLVWDDANLERWLRDTDTLVPDNNMGFSVPKAQDRANLIAFLRTVQ